MSTLNDEAVHHKSHRERNAGRKAQKKKSKKHVAPSSASKCQYVHMDGTKQHVQELSDKQKNPKAFTFNSAVKAEKRFRRKQDIETKKQHIPLVDRTPLEPPPILVAVVGPPKVGKSLLIQCLIKSFVKQPLTDILGPVTIVSGKRRRITFIECNNDISCMIDIAKVADLVLLLIDASFGFEMEIFEFLNICQVHGMPRIMGVLTHLDLIKNGKQMRKTKKTLKHRFWTEVYAGAKLFYLSGLLHNEYLRTEVKNLARFISVMKFRPLIWRTTHPYLLADRIEDLTSPELIRQNPKIDRTISLYGYIRGVPLNKKTSIHIPGCGDLKIKDVSFLPDPCPLPEQLKKRALVEKERLIYAPFSGVGGVVYDKDAVYVELGGSHSYKEEDTGLVSALMDTQETLDRKLEHSELQIFSNTAPIKSQDVDDNFTSCTEEILMENGRIRRRVLEPESKKLSTISNIMRDSDQEEEDNELSSGDESENEKDEDHNDSNKRKRIVSDHGSSNNTKRIKILNDKHNTPAESPDLEVYHSLSKNSDIEIKNKINKILNCLEATSSKKRIQKNTDNESFDEFSDEDSRSGLQQVDTFEEKTNIQQSPCDSELSEDEHEESEEHEVEINEEDEVEDELKWKVNLADKATQSYIARQESNKNLMKIVYSTIETANITLPESKEDTKEAEDIGGIFRVVQEQQKQKIQERELINLDESVFFSKESPRDWLEDHYKALLVNLFVTGKWKESEDAEMLLKLDDMNDDELYGDFEDFETGETHEANAPKELSVEETDDRKELLKKKKKLKEQFDLEYDNGESKTYYDELKLEVEKQAELNKTEFDGVDDDMRVQLEGYRPGMYIRVEVETVPCEMITHFDPTYPIIIGGLLHGEENIGYVQTRIKKHRWYSRILKTRDPLILSIGWRRFQTLPIFSKLEDNMRNRMLKYTPEHVACMGHFWGPVTPQGTGVLAVQDVASRETGFRIAATGAIVEMDKSTQIVKKLKLTGVPLKIYKKTAFIKDMFNSNLEVAKFEGAKIKTVSGIRGQIKKAISKPQGAFRATFEDKILLSDIVFCRTWYKLEVPKFYNPVTSLLLPPEQKNLWQGMKTTGQLKREQNVRATPNPDNLYVPIEREPKIFKPLYIPRSLQKELPYRDKPKLVASNRSRFEDRRVAVVREPKEENVARLMRMIRTNYAHKQDQLKEATTKRIKAYKAKMQAEEMKKIKRQKELKKQVFRELGKLEKKNKKT